MAKQQGDKQEKQEITAALTTAQESQAWLDAVKAQESEEDGPTWLGDTIRKRLPF
jgi:hypothetical protein